MSSVYTSPITTNTRISTNRPLISSDSDTILNTPDSGWKHNDYIYPVIIITLLIISTMIVLFSGSISKFPKISVVLLNIMSMIFYVFQIKEYDIASRLFN